MNHDESFRSPAVGALRADLALALRAAAHHGFAEGVCNHFSVELPDGSGRFLLNPRGLLWHEVQADDIVMVDAEGGRARGGDAIDPRVGLSHVRPRGARVRAGEALAVVHAAGEAAAVDAVCAVAAAISLGDTAPAPQAGVI